MVDKAKAKIEIQKAMKNGLFESNEDNCYAKHDGTAFDVFGAKKNGNGFSQALKGGGSLSDYPTELLLKNLGNDHRKNIWFLLGNGSDIEGIASNNYSYEHLGGSSNLGKIQPYLAKNNASYLHISYSEVELLLAEATQRGLISGNVQDYYQKGIEASILQWSIFGSNVDKTAASTFAKSKILKPNKELEEIYTQQWLTLFMNGIGAYANQRRTDFPKLNPVTRIDSDTKGILPKRLPYPITEGTAKKIT